jgi:dihydroorotate dehydrogenase (fumarate)
MQTDTSYLGFRLPHPFIAGASPFGHYFDTVRRLEDAGCAAVVMHSLFEEQITSAHEGRIRHMDPRDSLFAGTLAAFPTASQYPLSPDGYAEHLRRVTDALHIPVIGSLNGTSPESWLKFARVIEAAGADALELNLYEVMADHDEPAASVESRLAGIVREVKRMLTIPVAVKVTPFFTSFAHMAHQFDAAGADGLVLFNRFYDTDIDIATMKASAHVELSMNTELSLRLHWTAILFGRVRPSLAITGGVATPEDGVKAILSGADAVQLVSALLRHGPRYVQTMLDGLRLWMERHGFATIEEMRGLASLERVLDPAAAERAGYIRTLQSWDVEL